MANRIGAAFQRRQGLGGETGGLDHVADADERIGALRQLGADVVGLQQLDGRGAGGPGG
jgi:hypothetical protein